ANAQRNVYISFARPEEHRIRVRRDALCDVVDPIRSELCIGIKLNKVGSGRELVDVSDREQFKITVAVVTVLRAMQHVIQTSEQEQVCFGQETGSQMHRAVGLQLRQQGSQLRDV